jgi:CubicO group peptidase (beta-lactamase class C family)
VKPPPKSLRNVEKLGSIVEPMLRAARIPGAALAVVAGDKTIYASGFGRRDLRRKAPVTARTMYPIASSTKPINATLLGMLVDAGKIEWDAPVQQYVPEFTLSDRAISPRVTLRDLVTMRTGLPRHDSVWAAVPLTRAELLRRLPHLALSADFRQRFQYSNISVTLSGHVAELVTGRRWEDLVRDHIFRPLGMRRTTSGPPKRGDVTLSYHENASRKLVVSRRFEAAATAPSGGSVHSTVEDMAKWLSFNLQRGRVRGRQLIADRTLAQLHSPQVIVGERPLAGLPADAAYGLGWVIDYYNGHRRLSHGGYLHHIHSSLMLFPELELGVAAFSNFGPPMLADTMGEHALDALLGAKPAQSFEDRLALYERRIVETRERNARLVRERNTHPSHELSAYVGRYENPGYGEIIIRRRGRKLVFHRSELRLLLRHWHYDVWVAEDSDLWPIHISHTFDRSGQMHFHTGADGAIGSLSMTLEPAVPPIRFMRQ